MSSLPERPGIAAFIETSLRTLRTESPRAYFLMCGMLAPREVELRIDGESVSLAFAPDAARRLSRARAPTVRLVTSRQTILHVLDAHLTLQEAVERDAIMLQGRTEDLSRFHDALLTYVRGAVRAPSFPALLDRFRRASAPSLHGDDDANTG